MEEIRIKIFENFALISHIMPFYSDAHRSFILLSTLWRKSRCKLDEFYNEFRTLIIRYSITLTLTQNYNWLLLPSDLFKFAIEIDTDKQLQNFIQFITNIKERIGCFFNSYFMHEQIWIYLMSIRYDYVEEISHYSDLMKSIHIIYEFNENDDLTKSNFLDTVRIFISIVNVIIY